MTDSDSNAEKEPFVVQPFPDAMLPSPRAQELTSVEALAALPEWDYVRALAIEADGGARDIYFRHAQVVEMLSIEGMQIEIAEAGAQRLGIGIRIDTSYTDKVNRLYFETRQRTDGKT